MFKKLKDKITEEVKIPPIKFPQSMQQLAQAVVSPGSSSSSSSTFEPAPNDSFSIGDDFDDTPQNSPLRGGSRTEGGVAYRGGQATPLGKPSDAGSGAGFTLVDLQQDSTPQKHSSGPGGSTGGLGGTGNALSGLRSGSRRSSISSLTSDASFMFPTLETSGHTYNFQSDLESCSEASESVGPNINKEQLLSAYQKTQQRYQKYKGRYADLVRHYRELERENTKAKNILSESQDKALRRMAELKEQCNLEKQAKAHLEEALRSDLEEKDHLIHTLETKYCNAESQIKLLKNNAETATAPAQIPTLADVTEPQKSEPETATTSGQLESRQEDLLTSGDSGPAAAILTPELANTDTERVLREKNKKLESLLHKCREDITNKREIIKQLEAEKHTANCQVETLSQQLTVIQKREEEASLSLAKNKMTIHRELEAKEEDIKKLSAQLTTTNAKISELQDEILRVKEESKKEAAATKQEAKKSVETEIQQLKSQNKSLEETLAARDREVAAEEAQAAQALQRLHEAELELESLRQAEVEKPEASEITALKDEIAQLKASLHSATHNTDISDKLQPCLQMLRELRTASKGLRSDVDCSLSETKSFMEESLSMMQVNIGNVLADSFAELMKAVAECEVHRREAEDAKLSLEKLSEKVRTLDEILAKEKLQVAAKISSLEQELEVEKNSHQNSCAKLEQSKKEADAKISFLQESLETGKVSRQTLETETKLTLMGMEQELVEERNKLQKALVDTSSVEEKVQKIIKELKQQLKGKEKEKSHLEKELDNSKENLKAVELELCQLKTQLNEVTKNAEKTVEDVESVNRDLTERNNHIKELEDSLRDVNVQLAQAVSNYETCQCEKKELEEKFSILGDEYETKLKELSNKCASYELSASHQEVDKAENVSKLKEEKSVLQEDIKNLKEELYEKEKCLTDLTNERDSLKAEIMSVKTNEAEAKEMIDKLQSSHKQLLDENEKRLHDLEGENGDCKGTIEKLKKELHKKNELKAKLEKSLKEMDKNFSKQNHVTEELRSGIISNEETIKALSAQLEQKEVLLREKCEECDSLMEKYENLYSEEGRKSQECLKMKAELEDANIQLMDLKNLLHEKNVQLEELQLNVSTFEREHSEGSSLLKEKEEKCIRLRSELDSLKADLTNQAQLRDSLRKEHEHQVAAFEVKAAECADLVAHVEALTSENDKISQILKQKTDECAEKEAQLDNLADEMKRVDELSQELERISDESEANVQVLSSEASSLAQKVEELTANTQQLKEREVELLAKLQVSEDLEAEYIRLKDSEAGLKEKLKLAENIGFQLKQCQEELLTKVNRIEELEVENEKLRETERTLAELIKRAKETEAKCDRLQQDDADLRARIQKAEEKDMAFSVLEEQLRTLNEEKEQLVQDLEFVKRGDADLIARIQKAEEKEMTFSVLEEQLRTLREEKEQLVQDLESVKSKSLKKHTAADNTISSSVDSLDETDDARQPVIEEPIVVKKFTPLVESDPDVQGSGEKAPKENNEWEEKYNKLLRDYSEALQKKSAEIENLKEQYIRQTREMEVRQKERLWDRQDGVVNSMDGSSNGSMGTVERLQQQLTAVTNQLKESRTLHRQEVSDLRRILLNHGSGNSMSRSDNLEDATELEYLRNILYEYMMGKEPMVLARVIAAVVKFDSDQTNKVLQKEQQRLSLLGQLGIS